MTYCNLKTSMEYSESIIDSESNSTEMEEIIKVSAGSSKLLEVDSSQSCKKKPRKYKITLKNEKPKNKQNIKRMDKKIDEYPKINCNTTSKNNLRKSFLLNSEKHHGKNINIHIHI